MQFFKRNIDYIVTFFIEFLIVILSFLVYRIASEYMTEYGFSEYTLSRRSISFLQPLLMIGLGVAVPRYISIYSNRNSIFPTGLLLLVSSGFVMLSIIVFNAEYFAEIFFGSANYSSYIFPLVLLLFGYGIHAIIYGFLRGKRNVYLSNFVQLIHVGILPVTVLLYTNQVKELLYINSFLLLISCAVFIVITITKYHPKLNVNKLIADTKTMLRYGLPRVLGDFSLLALITLPSYFVLNFQQDLLLSGDVAYSMTLINLVGKAFGPLSVVLLPEIAEFSRDKKLHLIKQRFYRFILMSVSLTIVGYFIYYFLSGYILSILLGSNYRPSIEEISIIVLQGSFGYALYIVLRSFLDAIKVKAINSFNLTVVLIIYLLLVTACYYLNKSFNDYLYAFVFCINLLGVLTLIQAFRAINSLNKV